MASLIYNSALRDEAVGNIDYDTDTFYAMLVTSTYAPNKDTHDKRDDVTNEVTGTGYTAGGQAVTVSVAAVDTANDRVVITFAAHSWSTATITARGEVIYKRRGGAASADELVYYNDFGGDIASTAGTFSVAASTITKQNS
jgi:hypothetical protein